MLRSCLLPIVLLSPLVAAQGRDPGRPRAAACGFDEMAAGMRAHLEHLRTGVEPRRPAPRVGPRRGDRRGDVPRVTTDDVFAYEDSQAVLLTSFSFCQLSDLMVDASNELMRVHGDSFDFIGFFLNFVPDHQIGAAFYCQLENDVTGIGAVGEPIGLASPLFNLRPSIGLAGESTEGFVMMWNVDDWGVVDPFQSFFTRLVLGQEFEHRYAMFLEPLVDGRRMQGDDAFCGRSFHWNWQLDNQGSSMEVSEWEGSPFPVPGALGISFNRDIVGGLFSYADLYLMGYVTGEEMDAGSSELRFMEGSDCQSVHEGPVSPVSSEAFLASAGPRVPGVDGEQKDYRTGWIMLHLPGGEPTLAERQLAADILNQFTLDWTFSTLGRGTMDNTLPSQEDERAGPAARLGRWLRGALARVAAAGTAR